MSEPKIIGNRSVTREDEWTWMEPRSDEEVAHERADALNRLGQHDSPGLTEYIKHYGFTCDGCGRVKVCVLAFNLYNTHDDCLLEK